MKLGCLSYKLSNLHAIEALFNSKPLYIGLDRIGFNFAKRCDLFVGWGYGQYSLYTCKIAKRLDKPFIYLEDGFLRSPFISSLSKEPYSLVVDTKAPYYDSGIVTDLETLICTTYLSEQQRQDAQIGINFFVDNKLSKFAITNDKIKPKLPNGFKKDSVLLIDQVAGDLSLRYGQVTLEMCKNVFYNIKKNYPNQKIYLKLHPEVLANKKQGCFDFAHSDQDVICVTDTDLTSLLIEKPRLFVLTSLAGFEGVLHGCHVTVYGIPWYAGYGLTVDKHSHIDLVASRRVKTDLQTIFYCAYMVYSQYVNPITKQKTDFYTIIQHFARIKRHIYMMQGHIIAIGIRPWKRKDFFPWIKTPFNRVDFLDNKKEIKKLIKKNPQKIFKIVVWSYKQEKLIKKIQDSFPKIQIIRVEDGFIRSYGLGSDFFPPLSLCFDNHHLYFYYTNKKKSDLHKILLQAPFNQHFIERTNKLSDNIKKYHITKYNIDSLTDLKLPSDRQIVFVAGQVAGDASLVYGGLSDNLKTDYDLLRQVRSDYPDSFILYKPHPEVVAGNRKQTNNFDKCQNYYNHIETKASVISCIEQSHVVATLTSQVGFDALIRGKKVRCYGEAFYKNYGLCLNDSITSEMTLNDFIYATLIDYPLYKNKNNYILPETALDIIVNQKCGIKNPLRHILVQSKMLRYLYKLKKWIIG